MTPDEQNLLAIKGVISQLPEESRAVCKSMIETIRSLIKRDETLATLALAQVGMELQIANS